MIPNLYRVGRFKDERLRVCDDLDLDLSSVNNASGAIASEGFRTLSLNFTGSPGVAMVKIFGSLDGDTWVEITSIPAFSPAGHHAFLIDCFPWVQVQVSTLSAGNSVRIQTLVTTAVGLVEGMAFQQREFLSSSVGSSDAGKPVKLDGSGKLSSTMIPASTAPVVGIYTASVAGNADINTSAVGNAVSWDAIDTETDTSVIELNPVDDTEIVVKEDGDYELTVVLSLDGAGLTAAYSGMLTIEVGGTLEAVRVPGTTITGVDGNEEGSIVVASFPLYGIVASGSIGIKILIDRLTTSTDTITLTQEAGVANSYLFLKKVG